MYKVKLNKSAVGTQFTSEVGGLGFSVVGGQGVHHDLLYCIPRIKDVFPGGPAARQVDVREGDVLLEVNAIQIHDLTHHVRIKRAGGVIECVVQRYRYTQLVNIIRCFVCYLIFVMVHIFF